MDDWSSFRTTTSEQQRLRAALSGFCESQDLPEEQRAAYTAYLRKRIRPAVEMLIREDDFSKLERILQTGWLSDADRKRFLNLAADQQKWQAFRILLNRSSQDPMQEKYYNSSQYVYCANNPVKYIDPNGCDVKPAGTAELIMIQNTLPKEARSYVRLNKDGMIDRTLLNSYGGKSLNFNNLKTMVNSDRIVEVVLDDKFTFMGQDGKLGTETMPYNSFDPKYDLESDKDLKGETMGGLSTGESGFMGKTLFPDKDGIQNSPNGNIIVIINKNLSPAGAAENYSHEANGHALLYILNGGNHKGASHQPINGQWIEGNKTLMEMIINSKKETIENMQGT